MPSLPRFARVPSARSGPISVDASRIRIPVAAATVDCAVYLDGARLPGTYTHAAAATRAAELSDEGRSVFVWVGLCEPDEHQLQRVADTS
jgi:magnesium transporter